jgi:hypothetical protein
VAIFVTLDQVKRRLRITSTADDEDLQAMADQAEAAILDYIGRSEFWRTAAAAWTVDTVPPVVVAGILLQAGELYRFRGDDLEGVPRPSGEGDLSVMIRELLRAYHDPVVA